MKVYPLVWLSVVERGVELTGIEKVWSTSSVIAGLEPFSFFCCFASSWSNSTSSSARSCTSVKRLCSCIRSKTFGLRNRIA